METEAVFIDKAGQQVKVGDIIVYGHALGRCAGLRYGRVEAVKWSKGEHWNPFSRVHERRAHLNVQGVNDDWSALRGPALCERRGTVQYGDRVLIVALAQVPAEIRRLFGFGNEVVNP